MLPSVFPRLAIDSVGRVFPGVWKPVFLKFPSQDGLPFPGRSSLPTSFVSIFLFYIFSYLFLKTMICFSGCLMSSAIIQKLFFGIYSALKFSFDEFLREKVVSLSYSSAILGPPPPEYHFSYLHFERTFVLSWDELAGSSTELSLLLRITAATLCVWLVNSAHLHLGHYWYLRT